MRRRPPRSTLFPYTTRFRSASSSSVLAGTTRNAAIAATIRDTTYGGDLVSTWSVLRQSCKPRSPRSEEHTSELQSRQHLVCPLLLELNNATALLPPRVSHST